MLDSKDYSKLTLEELLVAEKKIKKQEIIAAFMIGILIGVMVYGIVKNGVGFLYVAISLVLISGIYKNSQNHKQDLKQIRAEMKVKNSK